MIPDLDHPRFSPHPEDRIIKQLDPSSLASGVCQSDTSGTIQSTAREVVAAPGTSNEHAMGTTSPLSEQAMPQYRPQRTRQPPNILS